jgi:hypothetical protein
MWTAPSGRSPKPSTRYCYNGDVLYTNHAAYLGHDKCEPLFEELEGRAE